MLSDKHVHMDSGFCSAVGSAWIYPLWLTVVRNEQSSVSNSVALPTELEINTENWMESFQECCLKGYGPTLQGTEELFWKLAFMEGEKNFFHGKKAVEEALYCQKMEDLWVVGMISL